MPACAKCKFDYDMPVDAYNKACEIRTCSFKRPHMRAFWFATIGFFMAFVGWFAMAPIMKTIKAEIGVTKSQVYNSNILAVSATILARIIVGPACDKFGARRPMAALLIVCSAPLIGAAFIQDEVGLYITRTLIGFVGATFVPCQFWTTSMFTGSIVGQANAMAGGWGNLGGGVTQATSPGFFEMFKAMGMSTDLAWRASLFIPAVVWIIIGLLMLKFADDCPEGHWRNRKIKPQTDAMGNQQGGGPKRVLLNYVVWILVIIYACCFGVELYVNNTMSSYLQDQFNLEQTTAGLIAACFGLMNLFARAIGGWMSDKAATRHYLRGRFWVCMVCVAGCGGMLIIYSFIRVLWLAIVVLIIFSCFVQASEGATYGIVPFVDTQYTGIVSGLVGAGGNLGAVCWGFVHKAFGENDREDTAYLIVGCTCAGAAALMLLIRLHGASTIPFFGNNGEQVEKALSQSAAQKHAEDMGMGGVGTGGEMMMQDDYPVIDLYEAGYAASPAMYEMPPQVLGTYPTPTTTPQYSPMNAFQPAYTAAYTAAPYSVAYTEPAPAPYVPYVAPYTVGGVMY
jgi:NNP family nitrate/nitrite transporter-like MFS transporter